ncbi:MAG TPA: MFS transporter [Pirellulales bacterium]|jgi:MFS family permease|nr:MFS transporter [Pirellulales bacterium]
MPSSDPSSTSPGDNPNRFGALSVSSFRYYWSGNLILLLGMQMQRIAVGWEIWKRTQSAAALAWIGLVGVLPTILLTLVVGHVADRFDRKAIIGVTSLVLAAAAVGLAVVSYDQGPILATYGFLLASGIARAFQRPAQQALVPVIVPPETLFNAITLNSSAFQIATAVGPALGGVIIAVGGTAPVYLVQAVAAVVCFVLLFGVRGRNAAARGQVATLQTLMAGVVFVFRNQVLLGALALDLFAVLLGGATALFPIYAESILHVGATGLGWMETAQAVGALAMAFWLASRPAMERSGATMLWAVAGFGLATIVFGISRWFGLSLAMLFLVGAFDNISVVVRQTLIQMLTPDEMRGRVSAVNSMFIGTSNDLGAVESGLVASFTTPTISVVAGGCGTIVVVALAAVIWPKLRRYGRLDGRAPETRENPLPVEAQ